MARIMIGVPGKQPQLARMDIMPLVTTHEKAAAAHVELCGFRFTDTTLEAAAAEVVGASLTGQRMTIAFPNAHAVNSASDDPAYGRVLDAADLLFADGSGLALGARLHGRRFRDNVNGTDLFPLLCERAALEGASIFLFGGRPGVASSAAKAMTARFHGLDIAGTHHGYVAPYSPEEGALVEAINASGANILLVGLGVPLQEVWIHRLRPRLAPAVVAGVGGLFDFYSGRIPRAPRHLRRLGLEWVWRLWQEPGRMWRRYVLGNPRFVARLVLDLVTPKLVAHADDAVGAPCRELAAWLDRLRAAMPRRTGRIAKRALDIAGAGFGLLLLAPLLAPVLLAVKLDSPGPAFFVQTRIGQRGRPFRMWKIRTMRVGAQAQQAALQTLTGHQDLRFKAKADPRITRIGRILRKLSVDELPQLWNVLKGDMALVGPRPALPTEVARYLPSDRDRLLVKPGLTCFWQVEGRADIDFAGQVALDRRYVRSASLLEDLKLLARTPAAVLLARGAY